MSNATITGEPNVQPTRIAAPAAPFACQVVELTPPCANEWDAYIAVHPAGTFFHTLAWRDAVEEVFAHKAVYLTAVRDARLVGVLPMFLVASRFAGRMLVSVPYGVGGGILAEDDGAVEALFNAAKRIAAEYRCTMIDLRSERSIVPGLPTVNRYVGFRRELPTRVDEVLGFLPRKARAAARNARNRFKLSVSFGDEQLSEVWRLYTISMRRLGSLNYPYSFFERLIARTPGGHWVSIVKWNGRTVAGLVTFLFRDVVMPYFIGTTDEARHCSAANYVYLTAMERGVEKGYRFFDFGRSRRNNTGSFNFKCLQGFEPRPLGYQYYTPPGQEPPNLSPANPKFRNARRVWSRLPLCVTRPLGARLTRHFPG